MLLHDWFPVYVARRLDLEPTTVRTYRAAVDKYRRWKIETLGKDALTEEMTVNEVADWLSHLAKVENLKPRSVNSYRSSINAVWSGAIRAGESPPSDNRLVPSCRVNKTIPIAWSLDDLKKLLNAAKAKKGRRKNEWNTLRRDFWYGLYLFLYDTGARFGAALALECENVDLRKKLVLLKAENSKTKTDHLASISDETAEVMKRLIDDGHKYVWPNGSNRQELYDQHKRTLQSIGLPSDRDHMFHCFRKTTATQLAINSSDEAASKALGHSSVALTKRTYIDRRQLPIQRASQMLPRPTDPDDGGERHIIKFARQA